MATIESKVVELFPKVEKKTKTLTLTKNLLLYITPRLLVTGYLAIMGYSLYEIGRRLIE